MKAIVLKPIVWNSLGYQEPSGHKAASGYTCDHGYGHEEWNGSAKNNWRGQQVFHTESTDSLDEFAATAELGIIPIASFEGKQYALGIATSVVENSREEMDLLANELDLLSRGEELWEVDQVKKCFNSKEEFQQHWEANFQWMKWRAPLDQFTWFSKPILLNPQKISGKTKLTSMHGRHQAISPAVALQIIESYLPSNHKSLHWLTSGDFDEDILDATQKSKNLPTKKLRKKYGITGGNRPATEAYEYWVEGNRQANPYHSVLQGKFVAYLKEQDINPTEDKNYIDVQYIVNNNLIYSEIKPTDNIVPKYAIRSAIGQLLEYQYRNKRSAELEIVIGKEPSTEDIEFVKSLGMILTYLNEHNQFVTVRPNKIKNHETDAEIA